MVESGCTHDGATLENLRTSRASPFEARVRPRSDPGYDAGCNRIAKADWRDVMDLASRAGAHV